MSSWILNLHPSHIIPLPTFAAEGHAHVYVLTGISSTSITHVFHFAQVGVQTESQRNVLFQWLTDKLIASKREGGPLAGIMFWEGAVAGIQVRNYSNIYCVCHISALRRSTVWVLGCITPYP